MKRVFVLDTNKQPLAPCSPRRARLLLRRGKAAVFRRYPFTIILMRAVMEAQRQPLRLKIDPGSKTTGLAIVNDATGEIVFAAELTHRGQQIKARLQARRAIRRNRRQRKTRYRRPRFLNRRRPEGWLPPSLESRLANILTWVNRFRWLCPIGAVSQELVRFDTQLLENPEIAGTAYQRGELAGYEVREYVLEKFQRRCAYCHAENVPLEVEHIIPKSRGGSDRVSNLTLACRACNQQKGHRTAAEFGYPEVAVQAKTPLKDATAVNATRWALYRGLQASGLPLEVGTGGRTKWNRTRQGLPKAHWLDAACVGASTPNRLQTDGLQPLQIVASGHGTRQMCGTDRYGFPIRHKSRAKSFQGFQTGDLVRAVIRTGKYAGTHIGRIAIRFRPSFRLNGFDVHPKQLTRLQRSDGYAYA